MRVLHVVLAASLLLTCTACPGWFGRGGGTGNSTDPQWVEPRVPGAQVAVVFVHGVFGDTLGTWKNSNGKSFFDLLKADPKIGPRVDLYAFGFPSKIVRGGSFTVQEAANRLHDRMRLEKILDYPAIVFVAHSMGGLVVLRELLTHREVLDHVRVLVFYATPQEGAQVAAIADHVARNPALADMLPADKNSYLQSLNDEWKSMPARPPVQCAYEKRATDGLMIVPWSSATRFCDGAASAIDADHITIVKPDRAGHDSYVVLANALESYVLGQQLVAKLETPDFQIDNGQAVLTISDPFGKRDARLVNAGGTKLSYTLKQFPDQGLFVIPGTGPAEIPANGKQVLQFVLSFGATASEYQFVLQTNVSPDLPVTVKIPDLPAVHLERERWLGNTFRDLRATLSDPQEFERLRRAAPDDPQVGDRVAQIVRDSVAKQLPGLGEGGEWVLAAEALNAVSWPDLAARAVRNAVRAKPDLAQVTSIRRLAARTGGLAGEDQVLEGVPAETPNWEHERSAAMRFIDTSSFELATDVATRMQRVPALAGYGSTLLGDVKLAQGNKVAAVEAYTKSLEIRRSPAAEKKLDAARMLRHMR
jgi:pimeloyl-ACP methyl ester carboxylesterase